MAKMFSSLRLATMRSHKRQRPGSVATTASSDSARTEETTASANNNPASAANFYNLQENFLNFDEFVDGASVLPTSCSITSKVAQVRLERESGSLGVTLRGGVNRDLVVTSVKPDGPAAKEGRVRPGDRLLAVDDAELRGLTLHEAQRALRRRAESLIASLTIEYDVANMDEVRTATSGPLLVQLERGPLGELGLTVRENRNGVFIESLRPASTADRCGALQPGDRLLAVDEIAVHDATTAAQLLRGSNNNCSYARIQILPRPSSCSARTLKRRAQPQAQKNSKNSLYTKETLSVMLRPDHRGLGIGLKSNEDGGDYSVDIIEPGGPAERSGVLLPGDRVIAINRRSIRDLQPDDVAGLLEAPKVELMIEYKVGGAVSPSSGVFTVRVARPAGAQPELGLIVNEDLVIAEVRRGSLAYRTGSLAAGDRLLAIDGQKVDSGDLRQAAQLLHRPGSSVVALTIRKPEQGSDNREGSITEETLEGHHTVLRCGRESLPSVDSAVDSWAEISDNTGQDLMRLWETGSIDSGQLDLPIPPYTSSSPNDFALSEPRSHQIVHVSLHKDPVYEDFGFSVSDGLYERGVYINRLRPGGPCDGVLRPFDRILRVNETSTEECDCCLAVPLIASAGARLDLTIARPINPETIIKNL